MKQVDWSKVLTILEVVYVAAILWFLLGARGKAPAGMRFWHALMRLSQHTAYLAGKGGMYAEKAYWASVERARK